MRLHRRWWAGLGLCVAVSACGTTVPLSQQAASTSGVTSSSDGLSIGSAPNTSVPGATALGSGATSTGALGGSAAVRGSTGALPGAANPGSTAPGAVTDFAASKKPIEVGIAYVKDAAAGLQAFGFQGATLGDMHLYAQILVNDVNKAGGLGGRKIVPVYFGYDANPGAPTWEQQDQEACATFTQDNHIEIGLTTWAGDGLLECLRKLNIPMIGDGPTGGISASSLARFSQEVVLGGFNLNRRATEEVRTLVREMYFTGWDDANGKPGVAPVKIGIVTYDLPIYLESVNGQMVPGIVAAGYPKPKVVAVAPHDSYDDISKMQAQISNAVLAFRAAGITHVIIWDDNGVATLFFMQTAESQKYRPRYGISSGNNMITVTKVASANQLHGAIGMGWVPRMDVTAAASPTSKYANSARRQCYHLMQAGNAASGSGFNETSAMMYCATILSLQNRWAHMPEPTPAGLIAAYNQYGSSYVDPQVPATFLSATQHDGTAGVYDYLYDATCGCMAYSGGIHMLSHDG